MTIAGSLGPFRGLVPYDEGAADTFFGRGSDADTLTRLVLTEGNRVAVLSGESGAGKTSLIRAALVPALQKRGVVPVVLGSYLDLDGEVVRATGRAGADPPSPGEGSADYLGRIARSARGGTVLVLDHVEQALADETGAAADLGALLARTTDSAGPRLRTLLCVDSAAFHRLDRLHASSGLAPTPGAWMTLDPLGEAQVSEILERTALQSGIFFESGLSAEIARDLTLRGACLPLDLQIVARVVLDQRFTSVRKYQRSGGVAILGHLFFERVCSEAGGHAALRVLLDLADAAETSAEQTQQRTQLARSRVDEALSVFAARGLTRTRRTARGDVFALAHDRLAERVNTFAADERARGAAARRTLRRRLMAGERLTVREVRAVRKHLGAALAPDEEALCVRSVRRKLFQAGIGAFIGFALLIAVFIQLRRSYTLALEPPQGGRAAARVVVRLGRPSLSFLYFLPNSPRFGSILADTGFSAAGMSEDTAGRIASGRASGTLDPPSVAVPAWLRDVLNGLRPVPRGVANALLDDPSGITSLKHAFTEPLARRETLEALAVIGRGNAGEDEILAEALADKRPEIRRRGVEVAAAISRRAAGGAGSHASILRAALGDGALDVRMTALREAATLDPTGAATILAAALADRDPTFRRSAEEATQELAERAPAAAADAVRQVAQSNDAVIRRAALALLDRIAGKAPAESAAALGRLVSDEKTPEEARVAALVALRKAGSPAADLRPVLEKAVAPEASPRLRSAALPLYARLVEPEQAEEIARAESKGNALARAASAAVWGTVAMKKPDAAVLPLKSLLYDPSVETRIEVARSVGYLKKDGLALAEKLLKDPNGEVQKAAIESTLALAPVSAYGAADLLGRTVKFVRPAVRRTLMEALGRMGETRPAAVINPLAKALKEKTDAPTRAAAATAFCVIAHKNAAAASPYLRIAARDDDHEVRAAAASCLADLSQGDPKGAAKLALELTGAAESSVRAAAAESLGRIGGKSREVSLTALIKLLGDSERVVRTGAEKSLAAFADTPGDRIAGGKRAPEVERGLAAALAQADPEEGKLVVAAAAKNGLLPILRQAVTSGDEAVRLDAVRAAGALAPPAVDVIRPAVDDRSNAVRAEAMRLLAGAAGQDAREVLPIFEAMLRGGDAGAREAAVIAIGDLTGAGEAAGRLLGEVMSQRSESVRAAAARALGRLGEREPDHALPHLERALADPSHDVRSAAIPGLALAWARKKTPSEVAGVLVSSEASAPRRFVALEALVAAAQDPKQRAAAEQALAKVASSGPPLARLCAQIGRGFLDAKPADMHAFLERLFGG